MTQDQLDKEIREAAEDHESSHYFNRDQRLSFIAGARWAIAHRLEAPEVEMLVNVISEYSEYFRAIGNGEYDSNRRPAPLRDFEQVLQVNSYNARSALEEARKR